MMSMGFLGGSPPVQATHHKAAENNKFHTVAPQKKNHKDRLVATLGKGPPNSKSRGPVQALFSQGSPEKTSIQEEGDSVNAGQSPLMLLKKTLQAFSVPDKHKWQWGEEGKADILENSWTDIVHSHKSLPKSQKLQQEALWELLHTEFMYINKLTIITDFVLAALEHVHRHGFLHEVTSAQLFSNIHSIRDAHRRFWHEVMYPMLQKARLTGEPFDPFKLKPGCLQFADRFSAYLDYCCEEEQNMEFTRKQLEINQQFTMFLMWVEGHPQCRRMRLGDMQAKPHQRITKYPLLLKAVLKVTEDLNTQQLLNNMINSISQFLDSINDCLLYKDDKMELLTLSQTIEGYELQGMSDEIHRYTQEFYPFNLTSPIRGVGPKVIRKLIMAETLKVRGRKDSKLEVIVLLFTDVLLLTKTQKKSQKQKVVRPPLSLERIHCAQLKDGCSFVLVEVSDLCCPVSVYSVSAPSTESCAAWIISIHQAQNDLQSLRTLESIKLEEPSDPILEESENVQKERVHANLLTKQVQANDKDEDFNNDIDTSQETEETERGKNGHCEDTDLIYGKIIERRATWKHDLPSPKNSKSFPHRDSLKTQKSSDPHYLLVGSLKEYPALIKSPQILSSQLSPVEYTMNATQEKPQKPDLWQDSWAWQSADESDSLSESWTFTRMLKSPRLRRKRPMNSQLPTQSQVSRRTSALSARPASILNSNSNSVSDSNENQNICRPTNTSPKTQDQLVLKMDSVRKNREVFWNVSHERLSESDSEVPKEKHKQTSKKIPQIKTQRSESLPGLQSSPLQGLLNRAKERERERGLARREGKPLEKTSLQDSNTVFTTPSPSPRQGKKESAAEVQKPFRSSRYDSHIKTETNAESSDNDVKNRPLTPGHMDWPGWCFDDEDVCEFTGLYSEREEDWFEETLTTAGLKKSYRHRDTDYSEV